MPRSTEKRPPQESPLRTANARGVSGVTAATQRTPANRLHLSLAILALLLGIVVTYYKVGSYGFLELDDPQVVYQNSHVREGLTSEGIVWALTATDHGNWRPLTWMSHMLDCSLFSLDGRRHHQASIALHALNAILLLLVLYRATGHLWRSFAAAAIFGLHPQRVESVAWIAERGQILGGTFSLITLLAYVWYTESPESRRRYGVVATTYLCALMANPAVFALPLLLLALDIWPLQRQSTPLRKRVVEKAPLLAAGALCLVIVAVGALASGAVPSLLTIPFRYRVATGTMAAVEFLQKLLWPQGLAVYYPDLQPDLLYLVVAGFLLAFLTISAIRSRVCCPYLFMGWTWYLVFLLPVLVLAQLGRHLFADRLTYLLLIGPPVAIVWAVAEWSRGKPQVRLWGPLLVLLPFASLGWLSWRQTSYWENQVTLYQHTLAVTEKNHRVMSTYGDLLSRENLFKEAEAAYREAIRWKPDSAEYHFLLAQTLSRQRREDEATVEYRTVIRLDPSNLLARVRFATLLIQSGSFDEAAGHLRIAMRVAPEDPEVQRLQNLMALMAPGVQPKPVQAVEATHPPARPTLQEALELRPLNSDQAIELGVVLAIIGAALLWPGWGMAGFNGFLRWSGTLARDRKKAFLVVALLPIVARLLLLTMYPVPEPVVADEFGHLLLADTVASGRVANPPHPMREHFESIYVIQEPSYASIYPFAQGFVLATAKVLGITPWLAVLVSAGVMSGALFWMLAWWLPPRWALLGGLLAAVRLSILSHRMNSYWGGSVPAIGGALLLGSLPRIYRGEGRRYGFLFGLGLAILAQTRPYEGFLISVPAMAALAVWLWRSPAVQRMQRIKMAVVPVMIVVIACGAFSLYYNQRVTGNALTLPYFHYKASHGVPQSFYWQKPVPPGKSTELPELKANYDWQLEAYQTKSSLSTLARMTLLKLETVWGFYIQPAWTLPLLAVPLAFRNRRIRFLVLSSLFVLAGVALYPLMYPHYLAPVCAVFLALLIQCLRYVRVWKWRGSRVGASMVHAIVLFSATGVLLSPAGADMMAANLVHTRTPRVRILKELEKRAGHHLIIVRYSPDHNFHAGVVYNEAKIDDSPVIWARDLGDEKNQELIRHYPQRNVWLFEADVQPIQLAPYPTQQAQTDSPGGVSAPPPDRDNSSNGN